MIRITSRAAKAVVRPLAVTASLICATSAFAGKPGGGGGGGGGGGAAPVGPKFVVDPAPARPGDVCQPYTAVDINGAFTNPLHRPRPTRIDINAGMSDWATRIQNARDAEVVMAAGQYSLGTRQAIVVYGNVTVRGATGNPADVVIYGRGYGNAAEALMIYGNDVTIADLSVTWVRDHAISAKGDQGADRLHVYNVHLYDTGTQHIKGTIGTDGGVIACSSIGYNVGNVEGDYINAIDLHGASHWVVRDNYIYNIWGEGNGCLVTSSCNRYWPGPAILIWNNSRGTLIERNEIVDSYRNIALGDGRNHYDGIVRNNIIRRTRTSGTGSTSTGGDALIELSTAHDTVVLHNTAQIPASDNASLGLVDARNSAGLRIQNNFSSRKPFWDRGGNDFSVKPLVTSNNVTDATSADFVSATNLHLSAAGMFRARGLGADLMQADGVTPEVAGDFDNQSRFDAVTNDWRFDIGADQDSPPQ